MPLYSYVAHQSKQSTTTNPTRSHDLPSMPRQVHSRAWSSTLVSKTPASFLASACTAQGGRGTIWPICHSEPRVGSFIGLQIADGIVKDCLVIAAQTLFDSGCIQVADLHPDDGCDVLAMLETYFVPPSMTSCTCLPGLMALA